MSVELPILESLRDRIPRGVSLRVFLEEMARKDPYIFAMYYRRLRRRPYTFDLSPQIPRITEMLRKREISELEYTKQLLRHRPFLIQPLRDKHPHKVYRKSRQVGVSELSITETLWFLAMHPHTKWIYCLPSSAEMLTRRGWKHHDEILPNDEALALDPVTHESRWEPVLEVKTFDWKGDLEAVGPFHCTPEHRWPVEVRKIKVNTSRTAINYKWYGGERKVVTTSELKKHLHLIPRLAPHSHDGKHSVLSPRLAAILGWVVSDGHTDWHGKRLVPQMIVSQSIKKHLEQIEDLLGNNRRNPQGTYGDCYRVTVKREDVVAIMEAGYRRKEDLPSIVTKLSPEAMEAMFQALIDAEGCKSGPRLQSTHFAQNHGPVLDAFQILCALTGRYANISKRGCYVVDADSTKAKLKPAGWKTKPRHYEGKVWCPRTPSGTFYMRYNGHVAFTGNTFPREKQLLDFSNSRIAEAFKETPRMAALMTGINQTFTKQIGESWMFLRSAWESNLGEGIDADGVTFDEKDRMRTGIEYAFRESLKSSAYGWLREVSTPTLPGRGVDESFQKSDQQHWFVRCTKCSEWQPLMYPDNIMQLKDVVHGAKELEPGTYRYACKKEHCRGRLDRVTGKWVAKYPSHKLIRGYQITQMAAPWITATGLMQNKIDYKYEQPFKNYVLGVPSVGETNLVTKSDIEMSVAGHNPVTRRTKDWNFVAVGIDWGHLNWFWVRGLNAHNNRHYLLHVHVMEDQKDNLDWIQKDVVSYIGGFEPDIIIADGGYGKDRNAVLMKEFNTYRQVVYAADYNPAGSKGRTHVPVWSDAGCRVLVDRTSTIKATCAEIRDRNLGFHKWNRMLDATATHFEHLASVIVEEEDGMYETIDSTGDDHLAHAANYSRLGMEKLLDGYGGFSFAVIE